MYLLLKYCLLVFHLKMHSLIKKKKKIIHIQTTKKWPFKRGDHFRGSIHIPARKSFL